MDTSVRIRMYRTGFGDCFLLSFGPTKSQHVLVDFGAHMHGEIGTMDAVIDNIEKTTGKKLALVVASHAHRDHISGFGKFADRFAQFEIGEVWMPWTDNPKDEEAQALERKHLRLYDALERHLAASAAAGPQAAAAKHALENLRGNGKAKSALANGFGTGAKPDYLKAGDSRTRIGGIARLSAQILGPSRDKKFLSRMNPPADQRFLTAPGDLTSGVHPFPGYEMTQTEAASPELAKLGQPVVPPEDLARLLADATAPADRLALALDNVRNNTSLVILFRFGDKALLFPGDAQWGNWQSWIGGDDAVDLIGRLDFFKLAHHGSENATPVAVVKALRDDGLAAMVSTQIEPFPTIPRGPLLDAVQAHCIGKTVVRSDWVAASKAPEPAEAAPADLPEGFKRGAVWIDCEL